MTKSKTKIKGPKDHVGKFKKGKQDIYIIPKKGESKSDAIKRVTDKHNVPPSVVEK